MNFTFVIILKHGSCPGASSFSTLHESKITSPKIKEIKMLKKNFFLNIISNQRNQ